MHARQQAAKITESLASAFLLCHCLQSHAQSTPQSQTFPVHGATRSCASITQLDSALESDSRQFFAGWGEQDYADALAWSEACANYGWHVPGRQRIPLLQAQRDKALGPVPAQAVASAPAENAAPIAPAQAAVAPGIPLDTPAIQIAPLGAAAVAAAPGGAHPHRGAQTEVSADGPLTDEYLDKHFHGEAVWVAQKAHLDIGDDSGPSGWTNDGTPAQLRNRLTADKIVLFCSRKTNSGENGGRPLLWDWRKCEAEEASAYSRLVAGNEFPAAGRGIVLGCAAVGSYIHVEQCMATMAK